MGFPGMPGQVVYFTHCFMSKLIVYEYLLFVKCSFHDITIQNIDGSRYWLISKIIMYIVLDVRRMHGVNL